MAALDAALKLIEANKFDEAARALAEIAAREPETRRAALGHRAWMLYRIGRLPEAEADWRAYLEVEPNDLDVRCLLAGCLRRQGRLDEATVLVVAVLGSNAMHSHAIEVLREIREARGFEPIPTLYRPQPGDVFPTTPLNPSIALLEDTSSGFAGSVHPIVGRFLYSLVRLLRPKTVIETGTWIGYSALCIGQALEDNGAGGHLHSFDIFGNRPGWGSPITGPCEDSYAVAQAHLAHAKLAHRVSLHQGDSSPNIRRVFENKPASFELAYIDGDHRLEGVLRDWHAVDELISEGGFMLLHDTNPDPTGWYGPRFVLEELRSKFADTWSVVSLPTADRTGVALMQKISKSSSGEWKPPFYEILRDRLYLSNIARRIALSPDAETHKR